MSTTKRKRTNSTESANKKSKPNTAEDINLSEYVSPLYGTDSQSQNEFDDVEFELEDPQDQDEQYTQEHDKFDDTLEKTQSDSEGEEELSQTIQKPKLQRKLSRTQSLDVIDKHPPTKIIEASFSKIFEILKNEKEDQESQNKFMSWLKVAQKAAETEEELFQSYIDQVQVHYNLTDNMRTLMDSLQGS